MDPVHVGVVMTLALMIGLVNPWVGLNLFITSECQHLPDTDGRWFGNLFTVEEANKKIESAPILAERLDVFVSRFGRLQDTVGDKLPPALLTALAEP